MREAAGSKLLTQSPADKEKLKSTFQDFAAGTFYKEMLKSLRKMHNKPAYMYGGHAEEVFQGQMDQQVAETFAHARQPNLRTAVPGRSEPRRRSVIRAVRELRMPHRPQGGVILRRGCLFPPATLRVDEVSPPLHSGGRAVCVDGAEYSGRAGKMGQKSRR